MSGERKRKVAGRPGSRLGCAARTAAKAGAAVAVAGLAGLVGFAAFASRRAERAVPPLGRFVTVDGQRLQYVDEGQASASGAPTLVLIHGLGGSVRNWTYGVVPALRETHRVVAIERPGSGHSTRPRGTPANVRAQAATLRRAIEALGIERPLLVGHSLGGAIALAMALDSPGAFAGLALLSPLTHPVDEAPSAFRALAVPSPLLRTLIAWTLAVPLTIRNRELTMKLLFGPERMPPDFPVAGGGFLGVRPKAFESASTDLVASATDLAGLAARYGELTLPVGVLYGTRDRILAHAVHGSPMATAVAGLDYEEIEGAGHMIPITQVERSVAFIRRMAARAAAG